MIEYALITVTFMAILLVMLNVAEPSLFSRWTTKVKSVFFISVNSTQDIQGVTDEMQRR
ncbi:MAG: hypothetical protein KAX16_05295 [Actinomycetia bacterium]|nr:hypothetical protein [Actinomycetes bacterium]